jgi:phage repressor protein C with HTH and peptisase S24 domain
MADVSESVVRKWRDGISDPSREHLIALSDATGVNLLWLATGKGPMKGEAAPSEYTPPYAAEKPAGYVAIPLFDVSAAAGAGRVVAHEEAVDVLHFKESWIRQELRASPSDLLLIHVDGESMEPTLRPGDVILVDRRADKPNREGVYILRMDGMLLVKRVQAMPGGVLKVSSDNTAYAPFEVRLAEIEGQDFAIIGRVVWAGRRM